MADVLSAADHLAAAAAADQAAADSFDRCDTDGFLSQWASGLSAQLHRAQAKLADNGGLAAKPALFDLDGNLVAAKLVDGKFGMVWGLLDGDDPRGRFVGWFSPSKARDAAKADAANARKGFYVGEVLAPCAAYMDGRGTGLSGSAWVAVKRTDGGFSRDVVVVDNGK